MIKLNGTHGLSQSALPYLVGEVCFFATPTPPLGFKACDGATVSRVAYAKLFSVIGTTFGAGNGTTTFALPDLRGEFIRGFDGGRGVDAGRVFGSYQMDELKSHTHGTVPFRHGDTDRGNGSSLFSLDDLGVTGATGGVETRPRNVALLPCIFTGDSSATAFVIPTLGWTPDATELYAVSESQVLGASSASSITFSNSGAINYASDLNAAGIMGYLSSITPANGYDYEISVTLTTVSGTGVLVGLFSQQTATPILNAATPWFSLHEARQLRLYQTALPSGGARRPASLTGTVSIRKISGLPVIAKPFRLETSVFAD